MKTIVSIAGLFLTVLVILTGCSPRQPEGPLPKGFVYVNDVIPSIQLEMRYYSNHNFVGSSIDGYLAPRCVFSKEATEVLAKVQEDLKPFGLGLKVFDAYRPQRAVDHFVRWAEDLGDIETKEEFYPNMEKEELFEQRYIAKKSGHTRGSAIDLTLISLQDGEELDMRGPYDFFGEESWPHYGMLSRQQRVNRMLLQSVMTKHGFKPYKKEWWHFLLDKEPFPESYFNFPIQ